MSREISQQTREDLQGLRKPFECGTSRTGPPEGPGGTVVENRDSLPPPQSTERILFLDDEEMLVDVGTRMLTMIGYEVVGIDNCPEALEFFAREAGKIDLVITDYSMPKMTGVDFAKEVMRIKPGIPIILVTGFAEGSIQEKAKQAGILHFLMKPVNRHELAEAVRKALKKR